MHPSSGQRLASPASSIHWRIVNATFVTRDDLVPPPAGCLHPLGTVYTTAELNVPPLHLWLQLEWERALDEKEFKEESDRSTTTHHSLRWLNLCRYHQQPSPLRFRSIEGVKEQPDLQTRSTFLLHRKSAVTEIDYAYFMKDDAACFAVLDAVFQKGVAIVKDAPSSGTSALTNQNQEDVVANVGRRLAGGRLSHGHLYGDTFHVQSVAQAINLAYTSNPLPPHQDLVYYQSPPGLQLLHCVTNHVQSGGESVLVDAIAAAQHLSVIAPEIFNTLTTCCATFLKQREGVDMVYRSPHIQVVQEAESSFIENCRLNIQPRVVAVRWSPPFHGPVQIHPDLLHKYWSAVSCFELMIDNTMEKDLQLKACGVDPELEEQLRGYAIESTWERKLKPGEILVFNNQRMVHGRRGFQLSDRHHQRHFNGCYTNMEDTLSRYRILWHTYHKNITNTIPGSLTYLPVVGNGCTSVLLK